MSYNLEYISDGSVSCGRALSAFCCYAYFLQICVTLDQEISLMNRLLQGLSYALAACCCIHTWSKLPYSTKHWRLGANSPKFYLPKFSITLVFCCCSTQSANVFSAKYILDANPPKFSTAKVLCYTVILTADHELSVTVVIKRYSRTRI